MQFPIFDISSRSDFDDLALDIYKYQRTQNPLYNRFCTLLGNKKVLEVSDIPYLPISFFKNHKIITGQQDYQKKFTSSGTTSSTTSTHYLSNLKIYDQSLDHSFKETYGNHEDYVILALLPHYLERTGSSLVYMVQRWIEKSENPNSGFYLNDIERLAEKIDQLKNSKKKIILIGVTFALLELADRFPLDAENLIIVETGGMKGLRKEITKQELHKTLKGAFPKAQIQSEYGMTELLSQAYAIDGIHFKTPAWMQVSARDTNDPLQNLVHHKTGGLNVIDLANYNSCPFIATQDLCKTYPDGSFEVLGRFDQSDIRGCNLMAVPH
ncbi:MAG: acyl transferase [Nonlabens sp.]